VFREGKPDDTKTSTGKLEPTYASENIVGPFKRNAHAHIGENALIAALLLGQTKTGVMIDVGAMHGVTLSQFYDAGWRVFAFEPDPTNRRELETRFGHSPNVTIDGRAVADRILENVPFYSSAESRGISSLHPFHKSHKETCAVSTTTIADFVRKKDLHHIDYLKIDAEGYDLLVLKGMPWDSIKPNVIECEFEDRKTRSLGYTMHDMAHYLIERGYKVLVSEWHPIIRYGTKHDWHRLVPYPCELDNPNTWGNLIAFRDQPDFQEIATIARRIVKVDKASWQGGKTITILRRYRGLYRRLVDYLNIHYPPIITIGRFGKWGLATLKRTFFGMGGIALLVITGLYIAGALIEPARWYLVGIASALLLLSGGLLALFYLRSALNRIISDQRTQAADIRADIKKEVSEINKQVAKINKQVSDTGRALGSAETKLAKMNVGNYPLFQQFNRQLTNKDLNRFVGEWAPKLGLDLDSRALAYIAHRICLAEDTCVGRLAGNLETMLLRVLVARSVKEPKLEVLEIGTLFGVGVAMIHENCRGFFNNVHMTVIDPLSGYYGGDNLDTMTKVPVTRDIFVHNMQRMNIPETDYTIIEKLSTEHEAKEQASKRRYNLLIIDGDHSYSGVKHDFYNYQHLVKRGGYIIFDDYGNPNWSAIKDFVDTEVIGVPELEFVGADVYTAVFRVITPQDLKKRGRKQHK
jgi:FkbM family methyltransferase